MPVFLYIYYNKTGKQILEYPLVSPRGYNKKKNKDKKKCFSFSIEGFFRDRPLPLVGMCV